MIQIDSMGLKLCQYQASIFQSSLEQTQCSSKAFIRRFMYSDFAKRVDTGSTLFEAIDITDAFEEIDKQYGASAYGSERFSAEELYWIGYIYRYWSYTGKVSSKQLYKKIKPEQLKELYFPYHSLDPRQAIERIAEDKGIPTDSSGIYDIHKCVETLRRVRKKWVS